MTKTRREFASEFRREAVALLESSGCPCGSKAAWWARSLPMSVPIRRAASAGPAPMWARQAVAACVVSGPPAFAV